jgi:hypothetical protein
MTTRAKTALKIVDADHQHMEEAILEASKQAAPMVQRLAIHRDRIDLAIKELESERFELISRRDLLRRQAEAVDHGFSVHIEDIEATLKLYEGGLNSIPVSP